MRYLIVVIVLLLAGCDGEPTMSEKVSLPLMSDVSESAWKNLSEKTLYFGHQSVGENIIDGMNEVFESNNSINVNIKEYKSSEMLASPILWHSTIGENGDPVGKIKDFQEKLDKGLGKHVDIAFAKFCYVDVGRKTDVDQIFMEYKATIEELKKEYPDTVFMHMTVPLMSHSDSFIDGLKRIIRDDNDDLNNIKRNELNQLIISEFKGKEPLFDLAGYESTRLDGSRSFFIKDGKRYYYLPGEYTDDGGHLNQMSRKYIAEQLLITLAEIVTPPE